MLLILKKYIYLFLVLFKFECKIKDFSVLPTFGFDILAMSFGITLKIVKIQKAASCITQENRPFHSTWQ